MARVPKYRKHSARNVAFCEYRGKRSYFPGKFNSPESLNAYAEFIKSISGSRQDSVADIDLRATKGDDVPIALLCAGFLDWARNRFRKNGRSTGTYEKFRDSVIPPLVGLFGDVPTSDFGPVSLKKLRQKFVESGLCRNEVNDRTSRVKRIFSWGVENELVSESVAGALRYVSGLIPGETTARETEPVRSVPDWVIDATLPFLPPTLDDMVRVHRLIGGRPQDVCNLRWCDIDESDDVWVYTPFEHKTEHRKKARRIAIRPAAQIVLEKYRHRPSGDFVFSPRETVRIIAERKRAARKTPVQPSQRQRGEQAAKRAPRHGERYSTRAYETAVDRAVAKHNKTETEMAAEEGRAPVLLPAWSPNQIRHAFATEADHILGKESARLLLGHSHQSTTEIYIDEDTQKIKEAARRIEAKSKDAADL